MPLEMSEIDTSAHPYTALLEAHSKHMLIFSASGKPVFSRYEGEVAELVMLLQAMLSLGECQGQTQYIDLGPGQVVVFFRKGPLNLCAISSTREPKWYLLKQLGLLYQHIVFQLTETALLQAFHANPGYDLTRMLAGTEQSAIGLIRDASYGLKLVLDAVPVLRLSSKITNRIERVLKEGWSSSIAFKVLFSQERVVHVAGKPGLQAVDLMLLLGFVQNGPQHQETWLPLCLPGFNSSGHLQTYCNYLDESTCLLILTYDQVRSCVFLLYLYLSK